MDKYKTLAQQLDYVAMSEPLRRRLELSVSNLALVASLEDDNFPTSDLWSEELIEERILDSRLREQCRELYVHQCALRGILDDLYNEIEDFKKEFGKQK